MVTKDDYREGAVQAAHAVLLELVHLLGAFRNDIVLIGGWVPGLLFPDSEPKHIGSTDVDLAFNHKTITNETYETICNLLIKGGYKEGKQPFIFFRNIELYGKNYEVQVDLLAGEYEGTGKSRRHQKIQDIRARKARGCDLAFEQPIEVRIEGILPEGGKDSVLVRVSSIVPFIIMKSFALADRLKEKDAWDIHFCLQNYPGGLEALATAFQPFLLHGLVKEGLNNIAEKFASIDHIGPKFVADFEGIDDNEKRAMRQREVYERIQTLLSIINK
ncbi:MAG: hypothetical protein ABII18_01070 [bacterium]